LITLRIWEETAFEAFEARIVCDSVGDEDEEELRTVLPERQQRRSLRIRMELTRRSRSE